MNSAKLRGMRVEQGYTHDQLSINLGISLKTYNRKELGLVEFNRNEILKIAKILNMSLQLVNEIFLRINLPIV